MSARNGHAAIGYVRVSTDEQADSGLGLEAQRTAIRNEARRRNWEVRWLEDAGYSAKDLKRPAITQALEELAAGSSTVLVVSKLDRLSRSLFDFASMLDRSRKQGWGLVALDVGVDTTTPHGRLLISIVAAIAEWEREMIAQRTKDALAVKRAQGVKLGRPNSVPADVVGRIVGLREAGRSFGAIARALNEGGVPTGQGGQRWYPSTVEQLVRRHTPTHTNGRGHTPSLPSRPSSKGSIGVREPDANAQVEGVAGR
jgi:DNA invertase Pin-like site-specific DNA recombinase